MADSEEEYNTNIIHESLGDSTNFWGDYTLGELILFLIPPFGFLVAMGMPFVPAALFFPTLALTAVVEVFLYILHKVRPDHYRLTEWLRVKLFWLVKKRQYTHGQGNQDTRQVTRLERVMPHGIERVDGAYVGAVEVEPANMSLQDDEKWDKAVKSLTRLSESLTGRAKLHVTTAEVDNESHIQAHVDRLDDPDVKSHSIFRGVLMEFVNRYTDDSGNVETETELQRKYYIVVWVTDDDIHDLQMNSDSIADYLTGIPVIGRLFTRFDSDTLTDAEREEFKAKKLHDRLETVDRAVNNMFRCRSRSVSPHELAHLTEDYWACETRTEREYEEAASVSPVTYSARELIKHGKGATAHDAAEGMDTDDVGGTDYEVDETDFVSQLHRPGENHRSLVAPTDIEWEADHALIDQETYTRCFWIETYPEHPTSGMLEQLLLDTDLAVDVSIHIDPYDADTAVSVMKEWISSLKMLQNDKGELEAEDIEQEVNQAKYIRQMVRRNHTSLFRVGAFIRLTAETEEDLRKQTNRLETLLRDSPSNCGVKRTTRRQEAGLVTVSPIGANELGQNRLSSMTGEALGALFPFSSNYLRMEDGIEYGLHGHNDSSLLIDPWALETGHSELVTGMPGGGKTHGTQARAMRMLKKRSDVKQIYIDPVGDMHGSAKMLDAKTITISGETPLNPCEMHPTPQHVLEQSPDMQPVSAKKDEVYGVIENFLQSRDVDLEMHSGLITFLIDKIFTESDIDPADPSTHTPENSPDLSDFLEVVDRLQEEPEMFPGATTESSQQKIQQYANELSIALHPFRPGSTFGNLSKESDLRLIDDSSKAVYLDLQQVEGSGSGLGKQSFIMQLLLSTLYQQAKNMQQKVEIIIDEAHYLFNDDANLESLNQIARHQRHAGLRLVMLSQTLSEFEDKGAAEEIAGMCPIKVHHREPELGDETATSAGLTDEQQSYIQHAEAGKESLGDGQGYSQALVRVDEHGDYPLTIKTSWEEKQIIDLDADAEDTLDVVAHEADSRAADFEEFVHSKAVEQELTNHGLSPEKAEQVLNGLSEEELVDVVSVALDQTQPEAVVADGGIEAETDFEFGTTE
ncbi:VirB4 family type IV secretion system protein [Haloarcula rubripromontorii]|uniref:VirB4 family type IV secretion system protein n=1 Tax=Haloarcula rubripromontorii TaxID=1705562 RepID=UPI00345BB7C8